MYIFASLGYRCSIGAVMQDLGIKLESHPFDWIISDLLVKIQIINNGFVEFLNINNYEYVENGPVYNIINNNKIIINHENYFYNKLYGDNENGLYHTKLALNHYDLNKKEDYHYFERCIHRFYNLLENPEKKIFLYINPIISIEHFHNAINNFNIFTNYFRTITSNFCIVYFILIYTEYDNCSYDICDNSRNQLIVIIYCNKKFIDYFVFCERFNSNTELNIINGTIKNIMNNNINLLFT